MIGQSLPWDLFTGSGVLVASAGMVILDEEHFRKLTARPLFQETQAGQASDSTPIVNVLERLDALAQEAESLLAPPYSSYFDTQVRQLARDLIAIYRADADACLGYLRLLPLCRASMRHSIGVLFMGQALADNLDLEEEQHTSLAAAALTMNLADLDLLDRLHTRTEALSDADRDRMDQHPTRAADILESAGVSDTRWLAAVRQHHEHMDGSGFPMRLSGSDIDLLARIVRVADFYCARTGARNYRPPKSPRMAVRTMFGNTISQMDSQIVNLLLNRTGLIPLGTLVRLANRETACIARLGRQGHPTFAVSFLDARKRPLEAPAERRIESSIYAVRGYLDLDPTWPSINWKSLWGY